MIAGLTRILTGHALMFEQDRLQGRINQLFERIEAQLRQVLRERECVRVKVTPPMKPSGKPKSWPSVKVCCHALSAASFKYRPTDDFDARWPLIAAQLQ